MPLLAGKRTFFHIKRMKYLLILFSTLIFISTAYAETGQSEGTRVSLAAEASEEALNDELTVYYRVTEKGKIPEKLQQRVNGIIASIKARLKKVKVKHGFTPYT